MGTELRPLKIQEAVFACNMGCWSPINLRSETQKKLGLKGTSVPCGRCLGCLSKKRADWTFRMMEELSVSSSASFLTLTISDSVDTDTGELLVPTELDKQSVQRYFKRVYKATSVPTGKIIESINKKGKIVRRVEKRSPLKYYVVGEFGTKTKRPHYHAVVFNVDKEILANKWEEGRTHQGSVTESSIKYVTKYLLKAKSIDDPLKPFAMMSKGLGKIYLKKNERFHKSNFTIAIGGEGDNPRAIPRYYREKIFTKAERELLRQDNLSQSLQLSPEERKILKGKKRDEAVQILKEYRGKKELSKREVHKYNSREKSQSKNY